jgi:hypothetical protein
MELLKGKVPDNIISKIIPMPISISTGIDEKRRRAHERMKRKAQRRSVRHDNKHNNTEFKRGDLVLVKVHELSKADKGEIKKFCLIYKGPLEVIATPSPNVYTLVFPQSREVYGNYNVELLRKFNQ